MVFLNGKKMGVEATETRSEAGEDGGMAVACWNGPQIERGALFESLFHRKKAKKIPKKIQAPFHMLLSDFSSSFWD